MMKPHFGQNAIHWNLHPVVFVLCWQYSAKPCHDRMTNALCVVPRSSRFYSRLWRKLSENTNWEQNSSWMRIKNSHLTFPRGKIDNSDVNVIKLFFPGNLDFAKIKKSLVWTEMWKWCSWMQTVHYFSNGLFLLFQIREKSRFPSKKVL